MKALLALTPAELEGELLASGLERYRAGQIARWVHARGVRDFAEMSDLGLALRERLAAEWSTRSLSLERVHASADGTAKLVLATADAARIESVLIPEQDRLTLCVSSQIGCSLDCSFCATGRMGFGRNLRADEIVDQLLCARDVVRPEGRAVTHVVFMGMGEPLLNLANVAQAIRVLCDPAAQGLSPRRLTVSTAGIAPRIAELGDAVDVRLAVSLHATTDELRDRLVPINRRFPLAVLLEACRAWPGSRRDRLTFEYALIADTNDSDEDARRLAALVRPLRAKINLIPLNEHPGAAFRRPEPGRVDRFATQVSRAGALVTVRRPRGDDVFAACGQLGAVGGVPVADVEASRSPNR